MDSWFCLQKWAIEKHIIKIMILKLGKDCLISFLRLKELRIGDGCVSCSVHSYLASVLAQKYFGLFFLHCFF